MSYGDITGILCPNAQCKKPMNLEDFYEDRLLEKGAQITCEHCQGVSVVRMVRPVVVARMEFIGYSR